MIRAGSVFSLGFDHGPGVGDGLLTALRILVGLTLLSGAWLLAVTLGASFILQQAGSGVSSRPWEEQV